jgi:hypothetical protein
MAELAQALRKVHERELDANEQAIAASFPPPPELSREAQVAVAPFVAWCETQRVRALPARPTSVASFAQWQADLGVPKEKISATLSAIESLHFAASLGNPIATPIVRTITAASTIEPPRSWDKDAKHRFAELPVELQRVVAAREKDRETHLRRSQNELADIKKLLRLQAGAEPKAADTTTESETTKCQ